MMSLFVYPIVFFLGLAVGSFLNCVIFRLEKGESFLKGRSYCPRCKRQLSFWDLIPVLSFVILRGRCRYCRQKISFQYPLVELATGFLFLLILVNTTMVSLISIYYLIIACFLIIIFVYDLKHYIIPDKVVYPAIVFALLGLVLNQVKQLMPYIYSAAGAAGFFAAIVLISRGKWMGVGDIKLAFLMGLLLGWPEIMVALFLAFFIGAIIGIGLIISGRKALKSEVPFGPFLVTGTFLALFWGEKIMNFYFNLFL